MKTGGTKGPLSNYRILDFGTAVAGPMVGQVLADMGGEVIKIESRAHIDGLRQGWQGKDRPPSLENQPNFHNANRGKLSVTVDMKQPRGVALIRELVKQSDAVTENFTPGVLDRAGLGYEALKKIKPDIILLAMSSAGAYGPLKDVRAYAPAVTSLAGLESITGYAGDPLPCMGTFAYGDFNAALHGALAIVAALRYRNRTGEGQFVDLSEWEAAATLVGEAMMDYVMNGRVMAPQGNYHPTMAPYGNYPCRGDDKFVSIAVKSDEEWQALRGAMGDPEWAKAREFADGFGRLSHREELDKRLAEWTTNHDFYEVSEMLQEVGVAAAPVLNIEEQYRDQHFQERGAYAQVEHPVVGREVLSGPAWKMSQTPCAVTRSAPLLGEHNQYVLHDLLGLSEEEIGRLVEEKVIY
ncbi:MAG: CoA transferase [Chloroflexi bacterium]|nr:CoA transferase [Chloroflexota bacterium]